MAGDPWKAYFWPGTDVLRNRLGEHDSAALRWTEYELSGIRQGEIERGEVPIPRTYDSTHLRAIHGHLFQDVYDWAGQYRTVNMEKDNQPFADTRAIEPYLAATRDLVRRTDWNGLDRDRFAQASAQVFAYVNHAHPFREGNGRASKVFISHVAEKSQFVLDFDRLANPEQRQAWNDASGLSRPRDPRLPPDPAPLQPVFSQLAQPRPERSQTADTDAQTLKAQQLLDSTYGKPMDAAARLAPRRDGAVDPATSHRQQGPPDRGPPDHER